MKKIGINQMSFETMVLTGNNAANPHGIPGTKLKMTASSLLTWVLLVNGYASDMTRTVAVGKPDDFKRNLPTSVWKLNSLPRFIKPGVTAAKSMLRT